MSRAAVFGLAAVMFLNTAAFVACADPAADYETLFGAEAKKVAASATKSDDAALAAKLFALVKDMPDSPDAQIYFAQKAVEFGSSSSAGYKTALQAIEFLEKKAPKQKSLWMDKKLHVAKMRYSKTYGVMKKDAAPAYMLALEAVADAKVAAGKAADAKALYKRAISVAAYIGSSHATALGAKMKRVDAIVAQEKQFKSLHDKLAKDPKDSATREKLVLLYIIARDAPDKASSLLSDDLDEAMRTYVGLASKGDDKLEEGSCLEMGNWYYKTLYPQAARKTVVLARAKRYYDHFLSLHKKADVQSIRVKMALKKINAELAKFGAPAAKTSTKVLSKTKTLVLGKGVSMKLLLIKGGKFMMGAPKSVRSSAYGQTPQHEVELTQPFYIGVTEVTQAQYEAVTGANPSRYKSPDNPVETVSWQDAAAFCRALSKKTRTQVHLPTEAQWEYACRAGTKTIFSSGDSTEKLAACAWTSETSGYKVHPVGKKKPNAFGLYDMHGNVREWCADAYSSTFYTEAKAVDPVNNPPSSSTYSSRVLRGGSYRDSATYSTSSARRGYTSTSRYYRNGFRVVILTGPRKGVLTAAQIAATLTGRVGLGQSKGTELTYAYPTATKFGRPILSGTGTDLSKQPKALGSGNVTFSLLGEASWSNFKFYVRALRRKGSDGFFVRFGDNGQGDYYVWNIGGWGNRKFSIDRKVKGKSRRTLTSVAGSIVSNKWYYIQIEFNGPIVKCFLDRKLIHEIDTSKPANK